MSSDNDPQDPDVEEAAFRRFLAEEMPKLTDEGYLGMTDPMPSDEDEPIDAFSLPMQELTRRLNEMFAERLAEPWQTRASHLTVNQVRMFAQEWNANTRLVENLLYRSLDPYRNSPLNIKGGTPMSHPLPFVNLPESASEEDTIPLQDSWEAFSLRHHFVDTPKMPLSDEEKRFLLARPQDTATLVELAREYALRIARGAALQELGVSDFPCSDLRGIVFRMGNPRHRRDMWSAEGGFVVDPQGPRESEEDKYDGPMAVQARPVIGRFKQPQDPDLNLDPERYPPFGVWRESDPHEGPPPEPGVVNLHSYVNPHSFLEAVDALSRHWQEGYPGKHGLADPNVPLLALFKHPFQVNAVSTVRCSIPGVHLLHVTVVNPKVP